MSGTNGGYTEGDNIEWHHQKITEYFTECGKIYDTFEDYIDQVALALNDFVNDSEHRGPEAESSKAFVNERQLEAVQEAIYSVEHLHGMMIGGKLADEVSLVDDFNEKVDTSESAIVKSQQLEKIISDYTDYNNDFRTTADTIKTARDACQEAIAGCSFLTYSKFTEPDPEPSKEAFEAFVSVESEEGFVQKFKKVFLDFMEEHSDDFSNSEFMAICPALLENLKNVNAALGDGSFDLTRYYETFQNVKWTDVKDLLSEEDRQKFLKFLETFGLYLKGLVPRCQVYKYDPVNMCNGNYINDRTDLTVPGRFPISFRRFYNAQSDRAGLLGKGWSCEYDARLVKDKDDDYRLSTFDGRDLVYRKTTLGKEEVYLEIHGEEGILREIQNGFKVSHDNGSYEEYDADGFLVAKGDHNGENTRIDYTVFEIKENDLKEELRAVPIRITTKDNTFLKISYDENTIITSICDHTGRKCQYEYEEALRNKITGEITESSKDWAVYEKEYHLTAVTYPNDATRRYSYNAQGLISCVYSPDGIAALINEYDSKRRVIHQTFPDGGEMSYEYDDEKHITTATEQNGCKVQYLSDELGRHIGTRYVGIKPGQMSMDDSGNDDVIEEKYIYNDKNQKTAITDKNGYTTRYTYDNRGHITSIIGPEGLHETYTYDDKGRVTSKKDSEGNKYRYKYGLDENLYCVIDPLGNKIRYYYEDGKVVSIRDAEDKRTYLTYDENGHISSVTDSAGVTIKYVCDSMGRVVKTIDPEGNETNYTVDESNNVTSVTDPVGNTTTYKYNSANLLTEVINPDGTSKRWEYNEIGKPSFYTDEDNRTTEITYNTSWKEDMIVLPNGGNVNYEYDLLGNRVLITDPEGRRTRYSYDNVGNIVSVGTEVSSEEGDENTVSVTHKYTYDGKKRIKSETDGEGNSTTYSYDKNDNLVCKTDAMGGKTTYQYDALGRIIKKTDSVGRQSSFTYDKTGKIKTATDPAGIITENYYDKDRIMKVTQRPSCDQSDEIVVKEYTYDDCGRVSTQVERDGFTVVYSYDKAGRVEKVTGSNGRVIVYNYDPMGRVIETSDCGTVTKYRYTGTGKLKSIIDALGNETRYSYDELDLLNKIERFDGNADSTDFATEISDDWIPSVDGKGHVTIYEHDLSGKLISVTDALGQKDIYGYDEKGQLCSQIDREGNETIYSRDNNGNIVGIKYADGKNVRYSYNALNVLEKVKDNLGLIKIESDFAGRIIGVTNPEGQMVAYEYGPYDEKTAIVYPDGKRTEYHYDAFRRLTELKDISVSTNDSVDGFSESVRYAYDPIGRLVEKTFPNRTATSYDYYQGGLLKTLISTDSEGLLDKYEYSYSAKGNRTAINRQRRNLDSVSGEYSYSYDELGRLSEFVKDGVVKAQYSYDAFGNRRQQIEGNVKTIYSYDVLDRLMDKTESRDGLSIVSTYNYDNRGNLIEEYENEVLTRKYSYDLKGLIEESVINPEAETREIISYNYNFAGQRICKKTEQEEIRYLTDITRDHYNLLAQTVNGRTTSFTYDDNVVSFSSGAERSYYQLDELGSTMYLTGTDGAAYSPYAYDPYGNRLDPLTGSRINEKRRHGYTKDGNVIQPFAFTGYQEEENGLYFAQVRSYDATQGRFTSEDRIRGYIDIPDTINRYEYCLNNPLIYLDSNGKWISIVVGAVAGAVISGTAYAVGAAIKGEKIDPVQLAASAAGGAAVGGLLGAGVTNPVVLGAAGGAASGAVTGTVQAVKDVKDTIDKGGSAGEVALSYLKGYGTVLGATLKGAATGGTMGAAFAVGGPALALGYSAVTGAVEGYNKEKQEMAANPDKTSVDWKTVGRYALGSTVEMGINMIGFAGLNKGLEWGRTKAGSNTKTDINNEVPEVDTPTAENVGEGEGNVENNTYENGNESNKSNNSKRQTPDQKALNDIAKESAKRAKNGDPISYEEAQIIDEWADEYNVPQHHKAYKGSGEHFPGGNYSDHTHVYRIHIPYVY